MCFTFYYILFLHFILHKFPFNTGTLIELTLNNTMNWNVTTPINKYTCKYSILNKFYFVWRELIFICFGCKGFLRKCFYKNNFYKLQSFYTTLRVKFSAKCTFLTSYSLKWNTSINWQNIWIQNNIY